MLSYFCAHVGGRGSTEGALRKVVAFHAPGNVQSYQTPPPPALTGLSLSIQHSGWPLCFISDNCSSSSRLLYRELHRVD